MVWPLHAAETALSLKLDDLRRKAARAKEMPTALNAFLRLHLGVWTEAETRWLPMEKWKACGRKLNVDDLKGRQCWAGLDLTSTRNLSSLLVLAFPEEDRRILSVAGFLCHSHPTFATAVMCSPHRPRAGRSRP
jgi:phage terminase large subunit-like protein